VPRSEDEFLLEGQEIFDFFSIQWQEMMLTY